MSLRIPSYGDYVRTGQGGPEGTCKSCGNESAMDHGLTGYECPRCHSAYLILKLKDGRQYDQLTKQVQEAGR
jgi:predicted RNA-binding Zn-ribbon protein involved in translation (DUF1610 family)